MIVIHWGTAAAAKLLQLCLTLCDPIDDRPPGSSVPEILQARILEWIASSFSRGTAIPLQNLTSASTREYRVQNAQSQ